MTYQVPLDGRHTAKSVRPSPSKSAHAGTSLGRPHCFVIGAPGWLLGITNQLPVAGCHSAKSSCPSPSKSPVTRTKAPCPVMPTLNFVTSRFLGEPHWPVNVAAGFLVGMVYQS